MSIKKSRPLQRDVIRCALYTRKSTEEGLELEFNSLDAQREAAEAYIASQKAEGELQIELAPGVNLNDLKPLYWECLSGPCTVTDRSAHEGVADFDAGNTDGSAVLQITDTNANFLQVTMPVLKPTSGYCVRKGNVWHRRSGRYSIGIWTDFYLEPRDVSFSKLKFKEGDSAMATTDGWFSTNPLFNNLAHIADAAPNNWVWMSIAKPTNASAGSKVTFTTPNFDKAYLFDNKTYAAYNPDPGKQVSKFTWHIPWLYSTDGGTTNAKIFDQIQEFTIAPNGDCTVNKGGATGNNTINGPRVSY